MATRKSEFRFLDFSAYFRHIFGRNLVNCLHLFGRYFGKKILETLVLVIVLADNLHLADFQHFLAKFQHIFGKREEFGRLLEFGFCFSSKLWVKFWEENLTKISRKSAKKVPKSREIGIRIYV